MSGKKNRKQPRKKAVPKYCHHKASGKAVVRIDGRDHYLGDYGTPESRRRYAELIARLDADGNGGTALIPEDAASLTVGEVTSLYLSFAQTYYRDQQTAKPSRRYGTVHRALSFVTDLHSDVSVSAYGPRLLEQARGRMVEAGWTRGHVNECVSCVKRAFRWAVSRGLCPVAVHQALCALEGLRKGHTDAKEGSPVLPAPEAAIEAVLKVASRTVADMIRLQLLTGMRAGELCDMRLSQIKRTGRVWWYEPETHKTAHLGRKRLIPIGPRGQQIVWDLMAVACPCCGLSDRRYRIPAWRGDLCGACADRLMEEGFQGPHREVLSGDDPYLFSPRVAQTDRFDALRAARKTRVQPSQESRRKARPKRQPGERYTAGSYNTAIQRYCEHAKVEPFHTHQLRHNAATRLRAEYGVEIARGVLGHSHISTTLLYAENDMKQIEAAIGEIG